MDYVIVYGYRWVKGLIFCVKYFIVVEMGKMVMDRVSLIWWCFVVFIFSFCFLVNVVGRLLVENI